MKKIISALTLGLLIATGAAHAQLADKKALTIAEAKKALAASVAEAQKNNWNVVIAVVDDGGHLVALERMDKAQKASIDIAIGKAKAASMFRRPSAALEEAIAKGRNALLSVEGYALMQGGMPIVVNGEVIGAVGVSGVQSTQDEQIAKAGTDTIK
jgi:glc operon protein GlcG